LFTGKQKYASKSKSWFEGYLTMLFQNKFVVGKLYDKGAQQQHLLGLCFI